MTDPTPTERIVQVMRRHIPSAAIERHQQRTLLIIKGGMGVDLDKLAGDLAELIEPPKPAKHVDKLPALKDTTALS